MKRVDSILLAVACLALEPNAVAGEPERSAPAAFLWSGDVHRNPGEPSTPKVITVASLYGLSAASFAASAVFGLGALSAASDAEAHRERQPRGFCEDPTTSACSRYDALKSSQNAGMRDAAIFAGLGTLLFLGGTATAQLWPNERRVRSLRAEPTVGAGTVGLRIVGRF